jgi:hypothetical protein
MSQISQRSDTFEDLSQIETVETLDPDNASQPSSSQPALEGDMMIPSVAARPLQRTKTLLDDAFPAPRTPPLPPGHVHRRPMPSRNNSASMLTPTKLEEDQHNFIKEECKEVVASTERAALKRFSTKEEDGCTDTAADDDAADAARALVILHGTGRNENGDEVAQRKADATGTRRQSTTHGEGGAGRQGGAGLHGRTSEGERGRECSRKSQQVPPWGHKRAEQVPPTRI